LRRRLPTNYKALKAEYDEKLRKSGFHDIEDSRGRLSDHKNLWDLQKLVGFREGTWQDIRDYYYWATDMVRVGRFRGLRDKSIWRLHADGYSSREIVAIREAARCVPIDQSMICREIKRIRKYLLEQSSKAAL
jgi:hypothetical protein